jgi:Sulfotransferase family
MRPTSMGDPEHAQALPLVYFLHIEKSAGTTVRHNLTLNYPAGTFLSCNPFSRMGVNGHPKTVNGCDEDVYELIAEIQDRERHLRCVAAHLPFGIDRFLTKSVTYFTFVREPVSRCVSCWYYAFQNRHTTPLWSVLETYDFDLHRILLDNAVPQFSNDQVRMVSGSSESEIGEAVFQLACDIVEERFLLAGAVEYFDSCLKIVASRLKWQNMSCSKLNVGAKNDTSILPASAEKYFQEANEWDIRFYEWLVKQYLPSHLNVT